MAGDVNGCGILRDRLRDRGFGGAGRAMDCPALFTLV